TIRHPSQGMAGESRSDLRIGDRRRRNRPETLRQKNGMATMRRAHLEGLWRVAGDISGSPKGRGAARRISQVTGQRGQLAHFAPAAVFCFAGATMGFKT